MQEFKSIRQRGLFPLPCGGGMERIRGGLSRGGPAASLATDVSCVNVCSETTCALNSLFGVEGFPPVQRASPAQDEARHVLHRAAEAFTPPANRVSPQESLRALLRSSAVYGDGSSTAPCHADLLALPESCRLHLCKISCDARTPNIWWDSRRRSF